MMTIMHDAGEDDSVKKKGAKHTGIRPSTLSGPLTGQAKCHGRHNIQYDYVNTLRSPLHARNCKRMHQSLEHTCKTIKLLGGLRGSPAHRACSLRPTFALVTGISVPKGWQLCNSGPR